MKATVTNTSNGVSVSTGGSKDILRGYTYGDSKTSENKVFVGRVEGQGLKCDLAFYMPGSGETIRHSANYVSKYIG